MSAKQSLKVLYARIPAGVKKQLQQSAKLRNHSLGDEITRLVSSQSPNSVSSDLSLRLQTLQLEALRQVLDFLNGLIETASKQPTQSARTQMFEQIGATYRAKSIKKEAWLAQKLEEEKMAYAKAEEALIISQFALGLGDRKNLGHEPQQPTLRDRRRLALLKVLEARPRGTKSKLAHSLGMSTSQLSQLLSGERSISEQVARTIESELELVQKFLDKIEPDTAKASQQVAAADISKRFKRIKNMCKS